MRMRDDDVDCDSRDGEHAKRDQHAAENRQRHDHFDESQAARTRWERGLIGRVSCMLGHWFARIHLPVGRVEAVPIDAPGGLRQRDRAIPGWPVRRNFDVDLGIGAHRTVAMERDRGKSTERRDGRTGHGIRESPFQKRLSPPDR